MVSLVPFRLVLLQDQQHEAQRHSRGKGPEEDCCYSVVHPEWDFRTTVLRMATFICGKVWGGPCRSRRSNPLETPTGVFPGDKDQGAGKAKIPSLTTLGRFGRVLGHPGAFTGQSCGHRRALCLSALGWCSGLGFAGAPTARSPGDGASIGQDRFPLLRGEPGHDIFGGFSAVNTVYVTH